MKVGLLTTGFPRFEGDHSGSFLLTLARGLVDAGHRVRVLAPEPRELRPVPTWPGIELAWVPYLRPRALQGAFYESGAPDNLRRHPARWAGALSFTGWLARAARQLDDCEALVSSWCVPCGWIASSVAQGRSHLCICHATDVRWLTRMPGARRAARRIASGSTSMWFLSTALRDRFFEAANLAPGRVTVHVGSMPIERPPSAAASRQALRRSLGIEGFTVLFLGRLVPVKGARDLLHAVASLPEPVALRIAGDGPERAALESLAARLGLDTVFEGWVAGERKDTLLRACDVLVAPSRRDEGLPTVLFEARARELPVIATEVGAIREALGRSKDVLLVPPGDAAALGFAIDGLRCADRGASKLRASRAAYRAEGGR